MRLSLLPDPSARRRGPGWWAIARARAWLDDLTLGAVTGTRAIAEREGLSERSVRMTPTLAFLSPTIVKAAIDGMLPHGVGLSTLMDPPLDWSEQQRTWCRPG